MLWPADEPWPMCEDAHLHVDTGFRESPTQVRLQRLLGSRWRRDGPGAVLTPEEEALKERDAARRAAGPVQPADHPVPMLPVAQLFLRDIPLLRPAGQADLLQLLWCPYEHEPDCKPATALFWRSAAEVGDILVAPPEPYEADYPGYVPEPCVLAPEAITDYPNSLELSPELLRMLEDWSRWRAAGVDSSYEAFPSEFYSDHLGDAPGWKVGGWAPWGRTDPILRYCAVCEVQMVPLLTIASWEWDGGEGISWAPLEDRAAADSYRGGPTPSQPTMVEVGRTDNMQIYVCPAAPEHPHTDLIQ